MLLGREIEGLDVWGRRGEDGEGGKMRDTEQKKKGKKEGVFVPVECWRCLESRCRSIISL